MDDDTSCCCKAMDDARAEIASLRAELAAAKKKCREADERAFKRTNDANNLRREIKDRNDYAILLHEQLGALRAAARQDAEEIARLKTNVSDLEDGIAHDRREIARLNGVIAQRTEELAAAEGSVKHLHIEHWKLRNELEQKTEKILRFQQILRGLAITAVHRPAENLSTVHVGYRCRICGSECGRDEKIQHAEQCALFEKASAALACTPTGMPSGVQQAEEKARLREALILARKEISDHDSDYHHRTRESTIEAIRAALACRPQGGIDGDG